jgi:hypothetical protein
MNTRVLLLLLLIVAGLAMGLSARAPGPTSTVNGALTDSSSFAEGFLAQLSNVQVAAGGLVELGESRERNLLIVGQRQSAMNAALNATDAWLTQHAGHEGDPSVMAYRTGARLIRQAMSDAQSAFFRLDWDEIARANVTLQAGADEISAAVSQLDSSEAG